MKIDRSQYSTQHTRLTVGFSSILLLVAVAATGAYSVRTLGQRVQTLVQVNSVKTEVARAGNRGAALPWWPGLDRAFLGRLLLIRSTESLTA